MNRINSLARSLMHQSSTELIRLQHGGSTRIIELNRPKQLNALNQDMVAAMAEALQVYLQASTCTAVIIRGSRPGGEGASAARSAFCAGGDVVSLWRARQEEGGADRAAEFFKAEYALNHLIGTFAKPVISLMDGVTMGGGMGISVHGMFRVCTENTVFAMPETGIGFVPDVGGTFMLPRLDRRLGHYLGITGARLKGIDVYHAGIATHCIPSSRLESVVSSLCAQPLRPDAINRILEHFSADYEPCTLNGNVLDAIEECFGDCNTSAILKRLEATRASVDPETARWADECLQMIQRNSPFATKVTARALERGAGLSFADCLHMEFNLTTAFFDSVPDLGEGIRAKLIDKTNDPRWRPAGLEDVRDDQVDAVFAQKSADKLPLFNSDLDFSSYPISYALPSVSDIKRLVQDNARTPREALIQGILEQRNHKMGLAQKLRDTFDRHVRTGDNASLQWHK